MNTNDRTEPVAIFLIKRVRGEGYVIVGQHGQESKMLQKAALDVLDKIPPPDTGDPTTIHHWLGPVEPTGHSVGVVVRVDESGEAVFQQSWISPPSSPAGKGLSVTRCSILSAMCSCLGLLIGLIACEFLSPNDVARDQAGSNAVTEVDHSTPELTSPSSPEIDTSILSVDLTRALKDSKGARAALFSILSKTDFGNEYDPRRNAIRITVLPQKWGSESVFEEHVNTEDTRQLIDLLTTLDRINESASDTK